MQSLGYAAGFQSRGCDFEPHIGKHLIRRLTKVNVTRVIRRPHLRCMLKNSKLLGVTVCGVLVWESKETYG